MLYQITLPYACFGVVVDSDYVLEAAPIGGWMTGQPIESVKQWVAKKHGTIQEVRNPNSLAVRGRTGHVKRGAVPPARPPQACE